MRANNGWCYYCPLGSVTQRGQCSAQALAEKSTGSDDEKGRGGGGGEMTDPQPWRGDRAWTRLKVDE